MIGIAVGFLIPFIENTISDNGLDAISTFAKAIVLGGEIWHYIFLYLVLVNSVILYVKKLREKINPNAKFVFLLSGIAFGFSIISIISATLQYFK